MSIKRRDFLVGAGAGAALAASTTLVSKADTARTFAGAIPEEQMFPTGRQDSPAAGNCQSGHAFSGLYGGEHLERIAFPLGGIGAGMICLEGNGALTKCSIRHAPDLTNEPLTFAALSIRGRNLPKVLEGQIPEHKRQAEFWLLKQTPTSWGLPRFRNASFEARFPFAEVRLSDDEHPFDVVVRGWSPFEPGKEDDASLPVAGLEYEFVNRSASRVEAVFSFNAANVMRDGRGRGRPRAIEGGFVLEGQLAGKPWTAGSFAIVADDAAVKVNHAWRRGSAQFRMLWRDIEEAACFNRAPLIEEGADASPGATLFVPFTLGPGQSKRITLYVAWCVPHSNLRLSGGGVPDFNWMLHQDAAPTLPADQYYQPWYAGRFRNIDEIVADWRERYSGLKQGSMLFSETLHCSTLPPEVTEAVAANLSILKSPTVMRQLDGRFWAWEGCAEDAGSCDGSCTHVWNYAQALPHLFPRLERTLRETEFGPNQNAEGHQAFRAALPIREAPHEFYAAADGQLGGIIKTYREWRISGNTEWVRGLWPRIKASLDYCIRTWDPRRTGLIEEPHHNTYDIEFWGADSMCTTVYLGALRAACLMGAALHEDVASYETLLSVGLRTTEARLFNGEFFHQDRDGHRLAAEYLEAPQQGFIQPRYPEDLMLARREGPPNQYGGGCLSDGVFGAWLAWACGLDDVLNKARIASHLRAVYRHNFKHDLSNHACQAFATFRATFVLGDEGGLLLCTWPSGGEPSAPFSYAFETWTGIEYEVASHLISVGEVSAGLDIVRACRHRYDGRVRNPFSEVETGHWYARALSSYALLQAFSGARYDAVSRILYISPAVPGDFRCFISTATGYGVVGVRGGVPFCDCVAGSIPFTRIEYTPANSH